MNKFKELCEELVLQIQVSYEQGVTVEEAEKLAGKFLYAQIQVAEELRMGDLDARTKKSGTKAIRAALYLEEVSKVERKPSDVMLEAIINNSPLAQAQQMQYDEAEVLKVSLDHYMSIFQQAHHHFKAISRQGFGG